MVEKIKIVNHRDSRVVLRRVASEKPVTHAQLMLEAGANNVDADEWARYADASKLFVEHGMLTVQGAVNEEGVQEELPKHGGDLSKLKVKAALRAIAACNDPKQLRVWATQDGRPEVRKALVARHEELMKSEGDGDDKDAA